MSLQKLTNLPRPVSALFRKKEIQKSDVLALTKANREIFWEHFRVGYNAARGQERDSMLAQVEKVVPEDFKNQVWENNHNIISSTISDFLTEYGKLPTKNKLAEITGLSRQTIHKHLSDFSTHPSYADKKQEYKLMADKILAKVFKKVMLDGDVKAMRLYLETVGSLGATSTVINAQTNFIQINQIRINQETLNLLSQEHLLQIETIIKSALIPETIPGLKSGLQKTDHREPT